MALGDLRKAIYLLAFSVSYSFAADKTNNSCPLPQKGKNIAGFIIACDYKNTSVEHTADMIKKNQYVSIPKLNGISSDISFYKYISSNLGIDPVNLCENTNGKSEILEKIRELATDQIQYVFMGISAHGGYIPVFRKGKFEGLKWALLTGGTFLHKHCTDYWEKIKAIIDKEGLPAAQQFATQNIKEAQRFAMGCSENFLTYDEIKNELSGRQALVIADSCYSGGICNTKAPSQHLLAMSAHPNKVSSETNQITAENENSVLKKIEKDKKNQDQRSDKIIAFYTDYIRRHPEIKNTNKAFTDDIATMRNEIASSLNPGESALLEKILREVYSNSKDRKEMRDHFMWFLDPDSVGLNTFRDEFQKPEHFMGELNAFLYDRDFSALDQDKNGKISIQEFLGDLKTKNSNNRFPPLSIGSSCEEAWLNFPLIDLKDQKLRPVQLKSFEHGSPKRIPAFDPE